ncbi:MAG TPA: mechanosensitive ion channel domain-containing protein [Pseudonocardia sp.]|jgi:small conductance mechanosensitive channel|uniref:mechanosensitive ion channel family protein n=1 Tax=Pseudonocardia sp. TaxID=60912 RepID=UPI002ED85DBF
MTGAALATPFPGPTEIQLFPGAPACAADAGSWCSRLYGWTHNDFLASSADLIVSRGLAIVLIVLIAVVARALLHRTIDRLVRGAANGPSRVPAVLRRRAPAGLRHIAAPLLSERRVQRANTVGSVLRSITSVVVLTIASIMIMAEFGLNLGPILASAGIAGVALGFGAQNLVRDFLSGMFMLLEDQYGVGDVVDLGVATGTVEAVGLRITTLRDVRGTVWHVRNGEIQRVGNKSQGYAVAVVDVPLAHTVDIAQAVELAGQVAAEVAATEDVAAQLLEPPEVLGVETVTVEGVTLRVTAKTLPGQQWMVQRALNAGIAKAFDSAELPRPYSAAPPSDRSQP